MSKKNVTRHLSVVGANDNKRRPTGPVQRPAAPLDLLRAAKQATAKADRAEQAALVQARRAFESRCHGVKLHVAEVEAWHAVDVATLGRERAEAKNAEMRKWVKRALRKVEKELASVL
jgi:hypothetical protein